MSEPIKEIRRLVIGPLSELECLKLAEIAAATKATRALEVGHYLGLSTSVLLASLPADVEFVTIDHHQGDQWSGGTSVAEFNSNVAPYIGDRSFTVLNQDMRTVIPMLSGQFGFVFYDADHTATAVADFWELAARLMAPDCTLVFDDADWAEQSTMRTLAEDDGFVVVTDQPFVRTSGDKHDPKTYTLEVMRRG